MPILLDVLELCILFNARMLRRNLPQHMHKGHARICRKAKGRREPLENWGSSTGNKWPKLNLSSSHMLLNIVLL